jgi:anti-anti-sigma regulatory factor
MGAWQRSSGRRAAVEALVMPTRLASGVPVLSVEGPIGAVDLVTCRKILDSLLGNRPEVLVIDVRSVVCDDLCLVVLALIRRYAARRGTRLALTASSLPVLARVRRARLADLYPIMEVSPHRGEESTEEESPVPGDAA